MNMEMKTVMSRRYQMNMGMELGEFIPRLDVLATNRVCRRVLSHVGQHHHGDDTNKRSFFWCINERKVPLSCGPSKSHEISISLSAAKDISKVAAA